MHGKIDQETCLRQPKAFSKGRIRVLLAIDVDSRGIDISDLPVVVKYDLPRTLFIVSVGRAGREGESGTAMMFWIPSAEAYFDLFELRHKSPMHFKC